MATDYELALVHTGYIDAMQGKQPSSDNPHYQNGFHKGRKLRRVPKLEQSQEPLDEQLQFLIFAATRLGLYDAADYLRNRKDN